MCGACLWPLCAWNHWECILFHWLPSIIILTVRCVHAMTWSFPLLILIAVWCFIVWIHHNLPILLLMDIWALARWGFCWIGLLWILLHMSIDALRTLLCWVRTYGLWLWVIRWCIISFGSYNHVIFWSVIPIHPPYQHPTDIIGVGCADSSLWLLFAFPRWLMRSNTFP